MFVNRLHVPVMVMEVLRALEPRPRGCFVDGTVGMGGHALAVLRSHPEAGGMGIDIDPMSLQIARDHLAEYVDRINLVKGSYTRMSCLARREKLGRVTGILLDLGISSAQLDSPDRGFSFRFDAPLDMRFDKSRNFSASDVVNGLRESDLADVIYRFGQEKKSKKIATEIVKRRPIHTTGELRDIVSRVVGIHSGRIHPATRVFQAIRIAVNEELNNLVKGLADGLDLLAHGGRLVVISYHSLEDRLVKNFFRDESRACTCLPEIPVCRCDHTARVLLVEKKLVRPSNKEIALNPRSRSARLRVIEKI